MTGNDPGSDVDHGPGRPAAAVLVVEDEALIRMVIADHLRDAGYAVVEARSADEAATMIGHGLRLNVVFSDINLPGSMNGIDLARWLLANRPEVPVLLTSGAIGIQDVPSDLGAVVPMLLKPYDPDEVVRRVEVLLAGRHG